MSVPIYVKVDKYKELIATLKKIDTKLTSVNEMIEQINKLKEEEDAQIKAWNDNLEDVRERLGRINDAFYQ